MRSPIKMLLGLIAAVTISLLIFPNTESTRVQAASKSAMSTHNRSVARANSVIDGEAGGALYRLVKPDNWNGGLVLYAHGSVLRTAPIALPAADSIVAFVTAHGYAIAYSSFSENGFAVKDGAQRTHQLIGIFTENFGAPNRVYIMGKSMGGLIAIKLAEDFPHQFAGALPACPTAGGTRLQFDYHANVRALFDVFYPGVLPGDAITMDANTDFATQIQIPARNAMLADNFAGAHKMAAIDQTPIPGISDTDLRTSIITSLNTAMVAATDYFTPTLQGRSKFDNRTTQYTSASLPPSDLDFINANIDRFAAAPSALNYMESYYNPTGNLRMPMVIIATSRDPNVPAFHRAAYAARVSAAGHSDLLFQRTITGFGHCTFTDAQFEAAFVDLTQWVEQGIAPSP